MLSLTEEGFNRFIEQLPVAIACFDEQRRYIALNESCAQINGVSRENTLGKTFEEVVPGLTDALTPIFDSVYFDQQSIKDKLVEGTTPASENLRYWMASYQPLPLPNGNLGLLVTAEEITQRVFANKAAETNKRLLLDVLNSLFTFVGLLDADGVLIDANNAPLAASGISIDDVKGKLFWDCYWWSYSEKTKETIKRAVEQVQAGSAVRFDIEVRVKDGLLAVDFMMEGLRDSHGALTHIIPSAIDISKRKQTEEQLKLSQARFETVTNRTVDGLVAFDKHGLIQFTNKRFEELVEGSITIDQSNIYTYIEDANVNARMAELVKSVEQLGIHEAIKSASKDSSQIVCMLKPKQTPVEIAFSPLLDGTEVLYLATVSDVSELYGANQALEKALNEKTALLNEVHHRVKNNLQVMSSLLSLQAQSKGTGKKTKEALLDSERRLKSMALIHELLYERDDFARADVQTFTNKLLHLLQDTMVDSENVKITRDFTSAELDIGLDKMVPYGFLLTELITNAFKHAFKSKQVERPTISVSIREKNGKTSVTISDNGQGLGSKDLGAKESLGSELIYIFTKQLGAELQTESEQGVSHHLLF